MSELKALRLSVRATQKQMADQLCLPLREYRELERTLGRLPADQFRAATFAALRIAVERDGNAARPDTELFKSFEELFSLLDFAPHRSRSVH